MARRRLTDLLREEAQKPEDTDEAASQPTPDGATNPGGAAALKEAETAIAHLRTSLEKTQQRETDLEAEVANLQTQLEEEQKLVRSLQADLKRTSSLKQDLEEARKDALQLAEANTKLTQELAASQKPAEKPAEKPAAKPAETTPIAQTSAIEVTNRQRQARALVRPVFPNEPSNQSSTLDTGWMD